MKRIIRKGLMLGMSAVLAVALVSCGDDDEDDNVVIDNAAQPVGAVYVMTNGDGQVDGNEQGANRIVTYSRFADGTLVPLNVTETDGNGGDFDDTEGLDPLISAYAITKTQDNAFILAVNAGSNTISALPIDSTDFSLGTPEIQSTNAIGPNSIDVWPAPAEMDGINSLVLVTNITRPEFLEGGEPFHRGTVQSFWLTDEGTFVPTGSSIDLNNRPSCVHISDDGQFAIVTSINAGAAGLDPDADISAGDPNLTAGQRNPGNQEEIVLFSISGGALTRIAGTTSTLRGNAEERNLPSAIGAQIVRGTDNNLYAVVTEAREFDFDGNTPRFPELESGSVSTWRISAAGLEDVDLDVPAGENGSGRTACWLDFNDDNSLFYVSNALEASIATYNFDNGNISIANAVSAQGTGVGNIAIDDTPGPFAVTEGWIDLWVADGFLYQLHGLEGVVSVWNTNNSSNLSLVQEVNSGFIPSTNSQGIVAF